MKQDKNNKSKPDRVTILCSLGRHTWGNWSRPRLVGHPMMRHLQSFFMIPTCMFVFGHVLDVIKVNEELKR